MTYLNPDETYRVEAISGAFMFFRREVYEDIGGLDESFFMYGEDLDWVFRASKRGVENVLSSPSPCIAL